VTGSGATAATVVFFHAHPDDETTTTAGTMAALADAGHRVVLVVATGGELGEVADGFLAPGESLAERRGREVAAAADVLGVARVELLGYRDSGMMGEPGNDDASSFWRADVEQAAARLAAILDEEEADVLVAYDEIGNYGHPDHVQVHRVGARAAALAGTPSHLEATMCQERLVEAFAGIDAPGLEVPDLDDEPVGMPESRIHVAVDVRPWLDRKRAAMRAHPSQIDEASFFLALPDDSFAAVFGTEWFIRHGQGERSGRMADWLLDV
jgi:LmbE family N-acetylglucosaminyl deacetylase